VAGVETLAFGVLVFVAGLLIATNVWSVVTTRQVADSIAREYLRAYTEQPTRSGARAAGERAADAVRASRRVDPERLSIEEPTAFAPCAPASVRVTISVPLARLPFIGSVGSTQVVASRRERIDAYRAGALEPALRDEPCGR
jgi:hypothetical protein